jgi:hypothetical protein
MLGEYSQPSRRLKYCLISTGQQRDTQFEEKLLTFNGEIIDSARGYNPFPQFSKEQDYARQTFNLLPSV